MKRTCSLLLASLMVASMTACGASSSSASSSAATPSSTGGSSTATVQPVTITMLHFFNDKDTSPEAQAFRQILTEYKAAHPHVTIEEDKAGDDIDQKVRILGAANELPDLYVSKADTIASFVESGQAVAIDDMLSSNGWKDVFLPGVFDEFLYNGAIYGVPFRQAFNNMVFYNKELFEKAGVQEFPATYTAFLEACDKLKATGITPVILGNKDRWPGESVMFNTIANKFTGKDWVASVKDGTGAKFTDAPFIEACKVAQEMYKKGVFNENVNSVDVNYAKAQFLNERAAMFIGGSWDMSIMNEDDPKGVIAKTDLALFPEFKEGVTERYVGNAVGWAFMFNAKAAKDPAKSQACVDLLKAIGSAEFGTISAQNGGIPVVKSNSIDESQLHPLQVKMTKEILPSFTPAPLYDTILPASVTDVLYTSFQELLIGTKTPEQYASEVQAELDASR